MGTAICYKPAFIKIGGTAARSVSVATADSRYKEDVIVDEILRKKIRRGTEDLEAGRTISLSEYKQQLK